MFYSHEILQRRGGKFGIVWLAATKSDSLTKRDYSSVNVVRTCEDLLRYITIQIVASRQGGPRPRLSLYLSSQLMYGATKVFYRQNQYLATDAADLLSKCRLLSAPVGNIDLKASRVDVNMPDIVRSDAGSMFTPAYFDPSFGLMKSTDLTDWQLIPDVEVLIPNPRMELSPSLEDLQRKDIEFPSSPIRDLEPFRPVFGSPLQAAPETITMKEDARQLTDKTTLLPGEQDLLPIEDIDLLNTILPPQDQEMIPQTTIGEGEALWTTMEGITDIDQGRLQAAEETPMFFPEDSHIGAAPVKDSERLLSPGVTPSDKTQHQTELRGRYQLELFPMPESPATPRRRRARDVYDVDMQIPRKEIRTQMGMGEHTSAEFMPVCTRPFAGPKELFNKPGLKGFQHKKLLPLWTRNAYSTDFKETDSDKQRPAWTVPELLLGGRGSSSGSERESPRRQLTLGEPPLSPVLEVSELRGEASQLRAEESRDISQQPEELHSIRGDQSLLSHSRDQSLRDTTDSRPTSRQRRGSRSSVDRSLEEVTLIEEQELRPGEPLATLHEELEPPSVLQEPLGSPAKRRRVSPREDELQELQEDDLPPALGISSPVYRRLLKHIEAAGKTQEPTTFSNVCPPTMTKQQAAAMFTCLLHLAAKRKVLVYQDEPYDHIFIQQGPRW